MTSITSGVFTDFCQAWVARFPGSELPAAWEETLTPEQVSFMLHTANAISIILQR